MSVDPASEPRIKVTKLDAAKRQLKTAIRLWFDDGDPVSIHTLAVAAYDILHTLARRKGAADLLFDSDGIKDEFRQKWANKLKEDANFFKHANFDPDAEREFAPIMNEVFIAYCSNALSQMKEPVSLEVGAFRQWFKIVHPRWVKNVAKRDVPIDVTEQVRGVPKKEFLDAFAVIWWKHAQNLLSK